MRTLFKAFDSPFNLYDIARLGCFDFFAGEFMPQASGFASGQGAGLFKRKAGGAGVPQPVAGSAARRIYALSAFERGDGVKQLVGIGVRTADLFANPDLPLPQRWALVTPHDLIIFTSLDGATWNEYSLRDLEKGGGDYVKYYGEEGIDPLEEDSVYNYDDNIENAWMNSPNQWRSGTNETGVPCLWCCTGNYLLEWDGYDARLTKLPQRCSTVALSGGGFYLSKGSRSQVSASDGQVVFVPGATSNNAPTAFKSTPLSNDPRIKVVEQSGAAVLNVASGADLRACAYVGGQWLVLISQPFGRNDTVQSVAVVAFDELPNTAYEIPLTNIEWLELIGQQKQLDLGRYGSWPGVYPADVFAIRRGSSRAYIYQRKDLQDAGSSNTLPDMQRETVPVLEMLSQPNLADFDITAGRRDGAGYLLGTVDGWVFGARLETNRIRPLARLDGAVLKVMRRNGIYYALTARALWHCTDGETWETVIEAHEGESLTDTLFSGDELFLSWAFTDATGLLQSRIVTGNDFTSNYLDQINFPLFRLARFDGDIYAFGENAAGEFLINAGINSTFLLQNERVTAAQGGASALYVGTLSGKLLKFNGTAWSLVATVGHPIGALQVAGDLVFIGLTDGTGTFRVWDGSVLSSQSLGVTCASDARVFFPGGANGDADDGDAQGEGSTICGSVILTDAGPVWISCVGSNETLWVSSPKTYGEIGEIFDEATAVPLNASGGIQRARCFVGPVSAGNDLRRYQPLLPGLRTQVLRPDRAYRFAVVANNAERHQDFEFQSYRREWSE